MKKPYSLDFTIDLERDRLAAVREILDTLERTPAASDLETMASYILYGKDENGQNAIQRRDCIDPDRRYGSFRRTEEKNESLEKVLDNPMTDQASLKPANERYIYTKKTEPIHRPKYDKRTGELIDPGDSTIPGMTQLWESIDRIAHTVAVNEGLVSDPEVELLSNYRLMQLRHQLIDLRRHQYYLRDSYRPTIHPLHLVPPKPQTIDWESDSQYWMPIDAWERKLAASWLSSLSRDIRDYETKIAPDGTIMVRWHVRSHVFNWEDPKHVRALIDNYSAIAQQMHDKLYADGRYLVMDLDRYSTAAHLSDIRQYCMDRKVDKASCEEIQSELTKRFNVNYALSHIAHILNIEIPEEIAKAARKAHLLADTPASARKRCSRCKRLLPRHDLFFARHKRHADGFSSSCKECERRGRMLKNGGEVYDARYKDAQMRQM